MWKGPMSWDFGMQSKVGTPSICRKGQNSWRAISFENRKIAGTIETKHNQSDAEVDG
jgi:hypothetical protein